MNDTEIPVPDVLESDANASGPHRLAGDMGVSSERTGWVRGSDRPQTHGAEGTRTEDPVQPPPEQSADPATGPEPWPANDLPPHPFDRTTYQGHSHG